MQRSGKVEQQIDEKIRQNRMITQWQLTKETGAVLGIANKMTKKLNYRRICVKWVPKRDFTPKPSQAKFTWSLNMPYLYGSLQIKYRGKSGES